MQLIVFYPKTCEPYNYTECMAAYWLWRTVPFCLLCIGSLGNITNVVILSRRQMRARSTCVILLVLAVCDLTVLWTDLLPDMMNTFTEHTLEDQSEVICKLRLWTSYSAGGLSIWLLAFLTIERQVFTQAPIFARATFNAKKAFVLSMCLAVGVSLVSSHHLFGFAHKESNGLIDKSNPTMIGYNRSFKNTTQIGTTQDNSSAPHNLIKSNTKHTTQNGTTQGNKTNAHNVETSDSKNTASTGTNSGSNKTVQQGATSESNSTTHNGVTSGSIIACNFVSQSYEEWFKGTWSVIVLIIYSLIPMSIILTGNIHIAIVLAVRRSRRLRRINPPVNGAARTMSMAGRQIPTTMLFILSVCFFVSVTPFAVGIPMRNADSEITPRALARWQLVTVITHILLWCNNTFNFFLYCLSGQLFKEELRRLKKRIQDSTCTGQQG